MDDGVIKKVGSGQEQLQSGHSSEVLVTFVESERIIFASPVTSLRELSKLIANENALSPLPVVKQGVIALKFYEEELCRVKILNRSPLKILYIDYGNEETVEDISCLMTLPLIYANIPPLAIRIELLCSSVTASKIYENERRILTPVRFDNSTWLCLMGDRPAECEYILQNIETFRKATNIELRIRIRCVISNRELFGYIETQDEEELFTEFNSPPPTIKIKLEEEGAAGVLKCGVSIIVIWNTDADTFKLSKQPTPSKIDMSIDYGIFAFCQYIKSSTSFSDHLEYEKYGPHANVMEVILNTTEYPVDYYPNKRTFGPPNDWIDKKPEINCAVICRNIPSQWYEDEIILLFGRIGLIYEVILWTDCSTGKHKGDACIRYCNPEAATKAVEKLNLYESKCQVTLSVSLLQEPCEFNDPRVGNDDHICKTSSEHEVCSCIEAMLEEIQALIEKMKIIEKETDKSKIETGRQSSLLQYTYHSLCLESLNPNENEEIIKATEFGCSLRGDITLENLLSIHNLLKPVVDNSSKNGIFRHQSDDDDDDDDRVVIVGLYGEIHDVPNAMTLQDKLNTLLRDLNDDSTSNSTSFILKASAVSARYAHLHPHYDGNGRMSRLLFNLILNREGLPYVTFPVFEKTRYTEGILSVVRRSDYTIYHRFICKCIINSLKVYISNLTE